jgi:nicotinamide phosphoribosyltransferase
MKKRITSQSDSYKLSHGGMYPLNTDTVYSYYEGRLGAKFPKTLMWSLQYLIIENLVGKVVDQEMIDRADMVTSKHIGTGAFNKEGWKYILDEYDGKLPVSIKSVPEGSIIPINNVMFTVENTDPKCFWLTNYLESLLSHVWYGSAVATLSMTIKEMMTEFLVDTSENPYQDILFMLHDFGYRSSTSDESAAVAGAGHTLNYLGTDTVLALDMIMDYYDGDVSAFSVFATEHSIMTAKGKEGEFDVVQSLLDNPKYDNGILSMVIDSYNYRNFIRVAGTRFKYDILNRKNKFVFRPDSGEPVSTTLEILDLVGSYFGVTKNSKGYKILNPKVGVLWGDGIDIEGIRDILYAMKGAGWAASNLVFGMGGALHQQVQRDTQRNAFKSSYQVENGVGKNISKDPLDKSKASKKGRLALVYRDGKYQTLQECTGPVEDDLLVEVFRNGELLVKYTYDEVKENMKNSNK